MFTIQRELLRSPAGAGGGGEKEIPPDPANEIPSDAEIGDILNYDFTDEGAVKSEESKPAVGETPPADGEGNVSNESPADGATDGQPADDTTTPESQTDPIEALKQSLKPVEKAPTSEEVLAKAVEALTKQAEGKSEEGKPAEEIPEADDVQYNMRIPDETLAAIRSEDPQEAAAGIHALSTGLAITIHRRMRLEMTEKLNEMTKQFPTMIQNHTQDVARQQEISTDFYGTYPELKSPRMKDIVRVAAIALTKETGASGYTPEFKTALKAKVDAEILELVKAAGGTVPPKVPDGQETPPAGNPTPPANNVLMGGNNSRGDVESASAFDKELDAMLAV